MYVCICMCICVFCVYDYIVSPGRYFVRSPLGPTTSPNDVEQLHHQSVGVFIVDGLRHSQIFDFELHNVAFQDKESDESYRSTFMICR